MVYLELAETFKNKFGRTPRIFRSPGRINIIGEHTDYNEGFVLPAAVDKEIAVLLVRNDSQDINLYAYDLDEEVSGTVDAYHQIREPWAQYILGVVDVLRKEGYQVSGFDCLFSGDIPIGAGMSSSAALECAALYGLQMIFDFNIACRDIALLALKAENNYVGVNCGIMDQFASVFGKPNQAIALDCRDLSYNSYPLELTDYQFVLVNSMVKHSLASSEYNLRRQECEEGVAHLQKSDATISSLRDVELEALVEVKDQMPEKVFLRCKHVVEEIARVAQACRALETRDFDSLGSLLYETHMGLQNEFEVSCEELDFLVKFTRQRPEVLGARMMGGGFGGCTLNLVKEEQVKEFKDAIINAYEDQFNKTPEVYLVRTAAGTSEITNIHNEGAARIST